MYGEGFLIFDGTPSDGSRSFYFNAVTLPYCDAFSTDKRMWDQKEFI